MTSPIYQISEQGSTEFGDITSLRTISYRGKGNVPVIDGGCCAMLAAELAGRRLVASGDVDVVEERYVLVRVPFWRRADNAETRPHEEGAVGDVIESLIWLSGVAIPATVAQWIGLWPSLAIVMQWKNGATASLKSTGFSGRSLTKDRFFEPKLREEGRSISLPCFNGSCYDIRTLLKRSLEATLK